MFHTGSYFQPENHVGTVYSVSRSEPKQFRSVNKLPFLEPSQALLNDWKSGMTEQEYIDRYRAELQAQWTTIKSWLKSLSPEADITVLCWEKRGTFCHRRLIGEMVKRHRLDCFDERNIQ